MTIPGNKLNDPFVTSYEKRETVPVFSVVIVPANGLISNPPLSLCHPWVFMAQSTISGSQKLHWF